MTRSRGLAARLLAAQLLAIAASDGPGTGARFTVTLPGAIRSG